MSVLLVSLRTDRPGHVPGEVVGVFEDGWVGTVYERSCCARVRVPLSVPEAISLYLTSVPRPTMTTSDGTVLMDRSAGPPVRARVIDTARLPTDLVATCSATLAAVKARRAESDDEAHGRVLGVMSLALGRELTAEEIAKEPAAWRGELGRLADLRVRQRRSPRPLDLLADEIDAQRIEVDRAALAEEVSKTQEPQLLEWDATTLSRATVQRA